MSEELRAFLQSWIDWVDAGAPDKQPYSRGISLCCLLSSVGKEDEASELNQLFVQQGLDSLLPFNDMTDPNDLAYSTECSQRRMHENKKRVAWVRQQLR